MRYIALIMMILFSSCGTGNCIEEGDVYQNLLSDTRIEIEKTGRCGDIKDEVDRTWGSYKTLLDGLDITNSEKARSLLKSTSPGPAYFDEETEGENDCVSYVEDAYVSGISVTWEVIQKVDFICDSKRWEKLN